MSKSHTPGPWLRMGSVVGCTKGEIATAWAIDENQLRNAQLMSTSPELLADLCEAAALLRKYEGYHRAKGTAESTEKAEVNAAMAARFEATIAKATSA